jgi:hypothetical protein
MRFPYSYIIAKRLGIVKEFVLKLWIVPEGLTEPYLNEKRAVALSS